MGTAANEDRGPFLESQPLFEAGQGGYAIYRIPCIVVTASGTVLAFCEARQSTRGDWGSIDVLMRRSADGGQTWAAPVQMNRIREPVPRNPVVLQQGLASADERTYNNPAAVVDRQSGSVHLLHCAEYARCYAMRSDDQGATWSEPTDITAAFEAFRPEYDWRVVATGPGHGIQLRSGRLLVPVWMSTGTGGHGHRPSCVSVIYSDDHGATWQRGDIVVCHGEATPNPSESVALQLHDGRVMLNVRNESSRHRRLVAFSADGARGWTEPTFAPALFEPICCAGLVRLSERPGQDRNRILFSNPDSQHSSGGPSSWRSWPRENLTVRMSCDEGETWPVSRVLDPGPSGYSDLAVGPDETIYCLYERGSAGGSSLDTATLTLARFNLAWLSASGVQQGAV